MTLIPPPAPKPSGGDGRANLMDQIRAGNVSNRLHVSYASDGTKDKKQTIANKKNWMTILIYPISGKFKEG